MQPLTILYAEDEANDIVLLRRAFQKADLPVTLATVSDGKLAIDYLAGEGPFADRERHPLPALILLDIKMPKVSGLEVLEWIRQQPGFESLPVLMFTSSWRSEDVDKAGRLGADDYLLKPSDPKGLTDMVKSLHGRWLSNAAESPSVNSTSHSPHHPQKSVHSH